MESTIQTQTSPVDTILRRALDLLISAAALLLFLVPLALIALIIRLDSPGPILFVQKRVGLHGREFNVYKFRSMFVDAEQRLSSVLGSNERSGPVFKMRQDPRVYPRRASSAALFSRRSTAALERAAGGDVSGGAASGPAA